MAPSKKNKKTKSAPNQGAAMLLMRALKRNQSVEIQTPPKPSGSTSSPVSVKKQAISSNLKKQLSKKRKRVTEKPPAKKKEGLQLLKRGPVSMHRIVRRKILGVKLEVLFNAKGEPYGAAATEMQSYIGVLAKTKAPIYYATWKLVPLEKKKKIWDCVKVQNFTSLSNSTLIQYIYKCSYSQLLQMLTRVDGVRSS